MAPRRESRRGRPVHGADSGHRLQPVADAPGNLTGGSSTIGELNGLNSTVYFFANGASILSAGGGGSTFGLLGVYGNNNTVNLTTSVRSVDPNLVRAVTAAFTEPLAARIRWRPFSCAATDCRTATEQFNSCPIGTINCVVFTSPIAAPATSTDDVVIGVGGAPARRFERRARQPGERGPHSSTTDDKDEDEDRRKRQG